MAKRYIVGIKCEVRTFMLADNEEDAKEYALHNFKEELSGDYIKDTAFHMMDEQEVIFAEEKEIPDGTD